MKRGSGIGLMMIICLEVKGSILTQMSATVLSLKKKNEIFSVIKLLACS